VRIKPLGESGGVDLLAAAVDERPESRGLMMAISPQSPEKIKTADNRGCHAGSTALAADEIALMQLSPVECELFWMRPLLPTNRCLTGSEPPRRRVRKAANRRRRLSGSERVKSCWVDFDSACR
jgi:hypothetical protein